MDRLIVEFLYFTSLGISAAVMLHWVYLFKNQRIKNPLRLLAFRLTLAFIALVALWYMLSGIMTAAMIIAYTTTGQWPW